MKKIFRLIPLLVLPTLQYRSIWMKNEQNHPNLNLLQESIERKRETNSKLSDKMQQLNPTEQLNNKQIPRQIEEKIQANQPEIHPQVESNQKEIASIKNEMLPNQNELTQKKQANIFTQRISELKEKQAIVNDDCPKHIINFLLHTGYQIHRSAKHPCSITVKNGKGDISSFDLNTIKSQNKDELQLVNNFVNPPIEITTVQQAKQLMETQNRDSFLVFSYLPKQQEYDELIKQRTKSIFDNFTSSRAVKLSQLELKFTSIAYNSSSNNNTFLIVRSKQAADYLKINNFNIGIPYILSKSSRQNGNESNSSWEGARYNMINLSKMWKQEQIDPEIINKATHLYINQINSEAEAFNKIRQMQMSGDKRKVLLIYTAQEKEQFHHQLDLILQNVARTNKNSVIVFKTQNEPVLKKVFQVQPERQTIVRLFNFNQFQKPLFSPSRNKDCYSRSKLKGPFKYENVCNFINTSQWQQYYQSKKNMTYIKAVSPNELDRLDNTLVLLQKQGCQGCRYLGESLDQLKRITKALASNSKFTNKLIYKYKIEDPGNLLSTKIRRYSIFNESLNFTPPTTTPRLYIFSEGGHSDLQVGQSLAKITTIKNQFQAQLMHDVIISDIINKIRVNSNKVI